MEMFTSLAFPLALVWGLNLIILYCDFLGVSGDIRCSWLIS